ncbi:MAG: Wzz/FepE/Etk N-terminal domain-containing protein [Pseudomonadota bacterium]
MLERTPRRTDLDLADPAAMAGSFVAVERLRRFLERSFRTIVLTTAICTALALAYAFTATPMFTASSQVLIETQSLQEPTLRFGENQLSLDTPQVESQLALLRSERIAEKAARKFELNVWADNQFEVSPLAGFMGWLSSFIPTFSSDVAETSEADAEAELLRAAINEVQYNMAVSRVGISYVLQIEYNSTDASHAAKMANAIAEAYVEDRLETRKDAARRGSEWLEDQIDALRIQMNAANLEVQTFRARRDYRIVGQSSTDTANSGSRTIRGVTGRLRPESRRAEASDENGKTQGPRATLEELESRADTFQKIYESYLQAYTETVQRQSYPVTNARVITDASKPKRKSSPKRGLITVGGVILGGIFGIGLALIRSALDYRVSSPKQIREELGTESLGLVARHDSRRAHVPTARLIFDYVRGLLGFEREEDLIPRLKEVKTMPMSRFSRGVKSIRTAINISTKSQPITILGITSSVPREGKTTFSSNLALLHRMTDARTLIVDADFHNPALTRAAAPECDAGLLEVLNGDRALADCIIPQTDDFPDFLPLHLADGATDAGGDLSGDALKSLFEKLEAEYDVIIVDMPPLKPATEALALSEILQGVVVVAEWESTPVPVLDETLYDLRRVGSNIIGVVLTKVMRTEVELYGARIRGRAYTG